MNFNAGVTENSFGAMFGDHGAEYLRKIAQNLKCRICLQFLEKPQFADCGHRFCAGCIEKGFASLPFALRAKNAWACPLCKAPIKRRALKLDFVIQKVVDTFIELAQAFEDLHSREVILSQDQNHSSFNHSYMIPSFLQTPVKDASDTLEVQNNNNFLDGLDLTEPSTVIPCPIEAPDAFGPQDQQALDKAIFPSDDEDSLPFKNFFDMGCPIEIGRLQEDSVNTPSDCFLDAFIHHAPINCDDSPLLKSTGPLLKIDTSLVKESRLSSNCEASCELTALSLQDDVLIRSRGTSSLYFSRSCNSSLSLLEASSQLVMDPNEDPQETDLNLRNYMNSDRILLTSSNSASSQVSAENSQSKKPLEACDTSDASCSLPENFTTDVSPITKFDESPLDISCALSSKGSLPLNQIEPVENGPSQPLSQTQENPKACRPTLDCLGGYYLLLNSNNTQTQPSQTQLLDNFSNPLHFDSTPKSSLLLLSNSIEDDFNPQPEGRPTKRFHSPASQISDTDIMYDKK